MRLEEDEALAKKFAFADEKNSYMDLYPWDIRKCRMLCHTANEKTFLIALFTATWQRYISAALNSLTAEAYVIMGTQLV